MYQKRILDKIYFFFTRCCQTGIHRGLNWFDVPMARQEVRRFRWVLKIVVCIQVLKRLWCKSILLSDRSECPG